MKDSYGRYINYARFSLTDRCNLRCKYCMPEDGVELLKHEDILSFEEYLKLAQALVKLGIVNFKLTGGEPLVRRGLVDFIKSLKSLDGVKDVSLTSNGILLEDMGPDLVQAGVDGINISLDTLNPLKYKEITRRGDLEKVLRGIDSLLDMGLENIKINTVAMSPLDEEDIINIVNLARDKVLAVRFIELMPLGQGKAYEPLAKNEILNLIEREFAEARDFKGKMGHGPAKYISLEGFKGKIGFIEALSNCFCQDCNRIRISPTGYLKLCLNYNTGFQVRDLLKTAKNSQDLADELEKLIYRKPREHAFSIVDKDTDIKNMNQIGG